MEYESGDGSRDARGRRGRTVERGALGAGGIVAVAALSLFLGRDLLRPDEQDAAGSRPLASASSASRPSQEEEQLGAFVEFVSHDLEDTWRAILVAEGRAYQDAQLQLFSGQVDSVCGRDGPAAGPFYCLTERKAYVDLAFYRALRQRFAGQGDFAQSYVLAHGIGHHVQNLLGIEDAMDAEIRADPSLRSDLHLRRELQADCLAGIWARTTQQRQLLEPGYVEQAMRAASELGSDTRPAAGAGPSRPETFTHGAAEQRLRWFRRGMQAGIVAACNTFDVPAP